MSQPAQVTLPLLPTELKKEILRFCDQNTLATTSRVSFAFLELASPLLYHDVVVGGHEGLKKLLLKNDPEDRQTHLDAYTDLRQIKKFTFVVRADESEHIRRDPPTLSEGRLPSDRRLHTVESLTLKILDISPRKITVNFPTVLRLFDPSSCTLVGSSTPHCFLSVRLHDLSWTRLAKVIFVHCVGSRYLRTSLFKTVAVPFSVVHVLVQSGVSTGPAVSAALDDIMAWRGILERESLFSSPLLSSFVLEVQHRHRTRAISTEIRQRWAELGVSAEKQRRWAELVQFDEVESGRKSCLRLED